MSVIDLIDKAGDVQIAGQEATSVTVAFHGTRADGSPKSWHRTFALLDDGTGDSSEAFLDWVADRRVGTEARSGKHGTAAPDKSP